MRRALETWGIVLGICLGIVAFTNDVFAQVTATCELNAVENRVYNLVPLEGTLQSTEEQLSPDLPFLQYLPKGYDASKKWPVIVFLHGIGEVGGNLRKDTEHSLPRVVESPEWDWPFIVLSPVLPQPSWHPRWQLVRDIFDYAVNELGGDPNRLYLTGISHGGAGTMAIGIELADRLAAIMPVTPGGDAANFNWDRRGAIASKPTMFIIGTQDSQYNNTLGWAEDLEGSGASPFVHYLIPTAEEHQDTIPTTVWNESHVFVSYQNLPHDIWHAAYGTFCTVLTTYKTVQYEWLLRQSLDDSAFTDPRDAEVMPPDAGAMGGAGGASEVGGAAGTAGDTTNPAGGAAGTAGSDTSPDPTAGTGGTSSEPPPADDTDSKDDGSCAVAEGATSTSLLGLLLSAGLGLLVMRRRATR